MGSIRLLTDSASDISEQALLELNVKMIYYPFYYQDQEFLFRKKMDFDEFYRFLHSTECIPTTAHIRADEFLKTYEEAQRADVSHLIVVLLSSQASNSYNTAVMAQQEFRERYPDGSMTIDVVDSLGYSITYGDPVHRAAIAAARPGATRESVLKVLRDNLFGHQTYFSMYNLDYAKKSGRISTVAAFVGEIIGFRPILNINLATGIIETRTKVRGDAAVLGALTQTYLDECTDYTAPYQVAYSEAPGNALALAEHIRAKTGNEAQVCRLGGLIALNAGPTAIGLRFTRQQ